MPTVKVVNVASEQMKEAFFSWSPVLKERCDNARGKKSVQTKFLFSPSFNFMDPVMIEFRLELFKLINTIVSRRKPNKHKIYASAQHLDTLPDDVTSLLCIPGTISYPNSYMYGSEKATKTSSTLRRDFRLFMENLGITFDFTSGLVKKKSSSGLPLFSRDLTIKLPYVLELHKKFNKEIKQILSIKDPLEFHQSLIKNELLMWFISVQRLQPDSIYKRRLEMTHLGMEVDADKGIYLDNEMLAPYFKYLSSELGADFVQEMFLKRKGDWYKFADSKKGIKFVDMRRRNPFAGSSICVGWGVLSHGIQDSLTNKYPDIFHIGDHIALENLLARLTSKFGRLFFIAFDLKHFEYSWIDDAQREICRFLDTLLPEPFNCYTEFYMHSGVVMVPGSKKDKEHSLLYTSKDYFSGLGCYQISDDDRMPARTEGNSSGQPFVSVFNKLYGSFLSLQLVNASLKRDFKSLEELSKNNIFLVNNGDDCLIVTSNEQDALSMENFLSKDKTFFEVKFEQSLPVFNSMYVLESQNKDGSFLYKAIPSFMNFLHKFFTPEHQYGSGVSGDKKYPNLGAHMRISDFLRHGFFINEVLDVLKLFKNITGHDLLDEFPLSDGEIKVLEGLEEPSTHDINLYKLLLDHDSARPLWDPNFKISLDNDPKKGVPIELMKEYYAVILEKDLPNFLQGTTT